MEGHDGFEVALLDPVFLTSEGGARPAGTVLGPFVVTEGVLGVVEADPVFVDLGEGAGPELRGLVGFTGAGVLAGAYGGSLLIGPKSMHVPSLPVIGAHVLGLALIGAADGSWPLNSEFVSPLITKNTGCKEDQNNGLIHYKFLLYTALPIHLKTQNSYNTETS